MYTTYRLVSASGTNGTEVVGVPCMLFAYYISNNNAAAFRYVHVFDSTGGPSGFPKITFGIPFSSGANQEFSNGIEILNGISISLTTSPNATGGVSAGEIVVNLFYEL